MKKELKLDKALLLLLGAALALRLAGLGWGLPALFNGDEPHVVNTAVYFGSGTLRPPLAKYPTGYMYLLAALYGAWYVLLRLFGMAHSTADFAGLFIWNPGGFYLIGRVVSALAGAAAVALVYKTASEARSRGAGLWAAALLAASPTASLSDHEAKPSSLMLFFAAAACLFAYRWLKRGERRDAGLCGAAYGLALATQYTAAPLAVLPAAAALSRVRSKRGAPAPELASLAVAAAAAVAAAFVASPYLFLDFGSFLANARDLKAEMALLGPAAGWAVPRNALLFSRWAGAAGLAWGLVVGQARALWLAPVLAVGAPLVANSLGGLERYLLPVYPALAVLAGMGLNDLASRRRWAPAVLCLAFIPGLLECLRFDRELMLPDTRHAAAAWLRANVSPGSVLLMDQLEMEPQVPMSREQAEELYRQTLAAGHPRSRYYRLMADSHPGGGYRVLRIKREAKDLATQPGHVEWSQKAQALLDLGPGLAAAREAGVDVLVTSSYGVRPEATPYLARFFQDLAALSPEKTFSPVPGRVAGPELKVYRLK